MPSTETIQIVLIGGFSFLFLNLVIYFIFYEGYKKFKLLKKEKDKIKGFIKELNLKYPIDKCKSDQNLWVEREREMINSGISLSTFNKVVNLKKQNEVNKNGEETRIFKEKSKSKNGKKESIKKTRTRRTRRRYFRRC